MKAKTDKENGNYMRTLNLLLAATAGSLTVAAPRATGQSLQSSHAFSVSLAMPLSSVTVREGKITDVWYTPKHKPILQQSLESYDKHVARATLTPTGQAWLLAWIRRYHVFSFAARYAPLKPGSYASAFGTRLVVQKGGRTRQSTWDETSRAKAPEAAAGALAVWARQMTDGH